MYCALTISFIVITGKLVPNGFLDFSSTVLGPKDPIHPPITFAQITKNLFVSIGFDGPIKYVHQPFLLVTGLIPVKNWSPVNA